MSSNIWDPHQYSGSCTYKILLMKEIGEETGGPMEQSLCQKDALFLNPNIWDD